MARIPNQATSQDSPTTPTRSLALRTQTLHDKLTHFREDAKRGATQLGANAQMRAFFGAQYEAYDEGVLALERLGAQVWTAGSGFAPAHKGEAGALVKARPAALRETLDLLAKDFAAMAAAERAASGGPEERALAELHLLYASANDDSDSASGSAETDAASATDARPSGPALTPAEQDIIAQLTHDLHRTRATIYQYIADRLGGLTGAKRTQAFADIPPTQPLLRSAE